MRIISITSAAAVAAAVLSFGAVAEAPHAARGAVVVSAVVAGPSPSVSAVSGDGNDPWD
jgi:hypothetical protein